MKHHYFLVEWHVLVAGYGNAEEHEGKFTVLATSSEEALDQANNELDVEYPRIASKTVRVVPTIGY